MTQYQSYMQYRKEAKAICDDLNIVGIVAFHRYKATALWRDDQAMIGPKRFSCLAPGEDRIIGHDYVRVEEDWLDYEKAYFEDYIRWHYDIEGKLQRDRVAERYKGFTIVIGDRANIILENCVIMTREIGLDNPNCFKVIHKVMQEVEEAFLSAPMKSEC